MSNRGCVAESPHMHVDYSQNSKDTSEQISHLLEAVAGGPHGEDGEDPSEAAQQVPQGGDEAAAGNQILQQPRGTGPGGGLAL